MLLTLWREPLGDAALGGASVGMLAALVVLLPTFVVRGVYTHSWRHRPVQEIAETLAAISLALSADDGFERRGWVTDHLGHVATCVQRYLPRTLAEGARTRALLLGGVQSTFDEMAAAVRVLAHNYFVPKSGQLRSVADEVSRLLIVLMLNWLGPGIGGKARGNEPPAV